MRIEAAGAQITDKVVEVLEDLQTHDGCAGAYIRAIDRMTRTMILDDDNNDESETLSNLRVLQMLRRDIVILSSPPDVDLPENDIPKFCV